MKNDVKADFSLRRRLDARLAAYAAAASAMGVSLTSDASAAVIASTAEQPFGINGAVPIDFNSDGQTDFEIDHDRVDLGGGSFVDYLQIDKNDINGELNPLAFDPITGNLAATFPVGATTPNDANEAGYVIDPNVQGSYPTALTLGTSIGPSSSFDYQESDNFQGTKNIRANRLIDEDATQVDQLLGGQDLSGVQVPHNGPNFLGLSGDVRYLGVKMELNGANQLNYGWIGVRIDNEEDATGAVVGWGYQSVPDVPIGTGQVVPEPGSLLIAILGGAAIFSSFMWRRSWR